MLEVDGKRPIDDSDLQVQHILPIDGDRPVVSDGGNQLSCYRSYLPV